MFIILARATWVAGQFRKYIHTKELTYHAKYWFDVCMTLNFI